MCGIVGMIARSKAGFYHSDIDILKQLLVVDGLFRGEDSTGVFQIQRNRQVYSTKLASHAYHLFATKAWDEFTKRMTSTSRIVIGHNRKATQGAINSENAHPFHEDHITLVHNGTLHGHRTLADVDVDSHAVARAFSERPAEEVIPELDGAFCFIWYDASAERLKVVRNKERPMNLIKTSNYYVLASESWMATAALSRKGIKIEETMELEEGFIYSFDLNGDFTKTKVNLRKDVVTRYPVTTQTSSYYGDDFDWEEWKRVRGNGRGRATQTSSPFRSDQTRDCTTDSCDTSEKGDGAPWPFPRDRATPGIITGSLGTSRPVVSNLFAADALKFKEREIIMFKMLSASKNADGRWQVTGRSMEPGRPALDITGYLSRDFKPSELQAWYRDYVLGKIRLIQTTNCGPTLHLENLQLDMYLPTHNGTIGTVEWAHICDEHTCGECGHALADTDVEFTSVTRKGINESSAYRITCPDCIQQKLFNSNRELHDDFEQRRIAAVQDLKPIGRLLSFEDDAATGGPTRSSVIH